MNLYTLGLYILQKAITMLTGALYSAKGNYYAHRDFIADKADIRADSVR